MSELKPEAAAVLSPEDEVRSRILGETAKIEWQELQRFFAAGHAVSVAPSLDLVDVAYQMSQDNDMLVASWMDDGKIRPVKDSEAIEWLDTKALMWTVVIKPWVLVQPVLNK